MITPLYATPLRFHMLLFFADAAIFFAVLFVRFRLICRRFSMPLRHAALFSRHTMLSSLLLPFAVCCHDADADADAPVTCAAAFAAAVSPRRRLFISFLFFFRHALMLPRHHTRFAVADTTLLSLSRFIDIFFFLCFVFFHVADAIVMPPPPYCRRRLRYFSLRCCLPHAADVACFALFSILRLRHFAYAYAAIFALIFFFSRASSALPAAT